MGKMVPVCGEGMEWREAGRRREVEKLQRRVVAVVGQGRDSGRKSRGKWGAGPG